VNDRQLMFTIDTGRRTPLRIMEASRSLPGKSRIGFLSHRECIGAEVTVISTKTHKIVGSPSLAPPDRRLKPPDSHTLSAVGFFSATFDTGTCQSEQKVYVV
jgi:hypothetical protein